MKRLSLCASALLALVTFASPAAATNWIPFGGDRWIWLDTDSVRTSGDVVTYTVTHSEAEATPPGPNTYRSSQSVNCRTLQASSASNRWPVRPDDFIVVRYCPKREAVKPAAPAITPAKPAKSAASKAASDLKVCETSTQDKNKQRIAACTRIIESKNPGIADLVSAHANRCLARYFLDNKTDAALADCNRALTLDPKSYLAVRSRGIVNSVSKRFDAALADFTQTIVLKPEEQMGYYDRGIVHVKRKDLTNAVADFTAMHKLRKDEMFYRDVLCWARTSINAELETALADCEAVVRLQPDSTSSGFKSAAHEQLALVRLRKGDLSGARTAADKAVALDAKSARALYTRALINAREGRTMASADDRAAATKISETIAKAYDDIGLKLMVQAESAPFCPAMNALVKASAERAASKAKADVAMPGATYCVAIERGYWCTWDTGRAGAAAKQKALATAAAACLAGYTRTDSNGATGPAASFKQANTSITVGTMYAADVKAIVAAGIAVSIAKPEAAKSAPPSPAANSAAADKRLQMLKDGCAKKIFSEKECKEAGISQ